MEKIKNIIVLTVEIFLAIFVIVFISVYIGASKTEDNYKKAITSMNRGDWTNALDIMEEIPHYKDSSELYIYIYPNKLFYNNYETNEDALSGYREALKYIQDEKDKLIPLHDKKYIQGFAELKETLNFKISEIGAQKQNDAVNNVLNDSVISIRNGDLSGATVKLNSITSTALEPVKTELLAYVDFLNLIKLNDQNAILKSIENLNPNYAGVLSDDIKNAVQAYVDINKWMTMYKGTSNATQAQGISLGMKKADVIISMGNPINDKLITNKYGNFEIMTYPNNTVLYMENDSLKAFKAQ